MDRGNLTQVLRNDPALPYLTKLRIAIDASEGVEYLHSRDPPIVHRDLKSLNLLVAQDYTCKVADFGLSKASSGSSLNSKVGSLNWCAPEVLLHAAPYTPAGDSYSFGMILWELLTHTPPFAKMHPLQIVRAIDRGDLPIIPPATPEKYATLIRACWAKDAKRRPNFSTILAVLHMLYTEAETSPVVLTPGISVTPPPAADVSSPPQ
jgi:serine/threonine protein kinase